MWKEKLEEIKKLCKSFGEELNEGATNEEIILFKQKIKEILNVEATEEYFNLLNTINGFEFNGTILYGIDDEFSKSKQNQKVNGFIKNNQDWYENPWQKAYVFFGDGNMSWYCFDISKGIYVELDKPSGELQQEFSNFTDMIEYALEQSLL